MDIITGRVLKETVKKVLTAILKIGRTDHPSNFTVLFNIFNWIVSDIFPQELTLSN